MTPFTANAPATNKSRHPIILISFDTKEIFDFVGSLLMAQATLVKKNNVTMQFLLEQPKVRKLHLPTPVASNPRMQELIDVVRHTQATHARVQLRYALNHLLDVQAFVLEYMRQLAGRVALVFPDIDAWRLGWQQTAHCAYTGPYIFTHYHPKRALPDGFTVCYLLIGLAPTLVHQTWDCVIYVDCLPVSYHADRPQERVLHVACHPATTAMPDQHVLDMSPLCHAATRQQVVLELPMSDQELSVAKDLPEQCLWRYHAWPHLTVGYKLARTTPLPSTKMRLVAQVVSMLHAKGEASVRVLLITHFGALARQALEQLQSQGCNPQDAPRGLTKSQVLWHMAHQFSKSHRAFVVASDCNIALDLFAASATHVFILDGSVYTRVLAQLHASAHAMMAYLRVSVPDSWLAQNIERPELRTMFHISLERASQWKVRLTTAMAEGIVDVSLACMSLSQLEDCRSLTLLRGLAPQSAQPVLLNLATLRDLKSLLGHLWYVPANVQACPDTLRKFVHTSNMLQSVVTRDALLAPHVAALLTFCLAKIVVDTLGCAMLGLSSFGGVHVMHCRDSLQCALFVIGVVILPDSRRAAVNQGECLRLLHQKFPDHAVFCNVLWPDLGTMAWREALPELLVCPESAV